jgi:hypothetical protein
MPAPMRLQTSESSKSIAKTTKLLSNPRVATTETTNESSMPSKLVCFAPFPHALEDLHAEAAWA